MNRTSILDDETFRVAIKRLTIQHQVILTSECGSLSSLIRAVVTRSRNLGELDLTILAWLRRHLGEVSETAKRAAIAAMATRDGRRLAETADAAVQDLLAESRRRLAQSLATRGEGLENFCRDRRRRLWSGPLGWSLLCSHSRAGEVSRLSGSRPPSRDGFPQAPADFRDYARDDVVVGDQAGAVG